jgi:AraC-like DNA-binding protein
VSRPRIRSATARFAHRKPEDTEPFRQFLRAPLRFDTEHYSLVFSAFWLNRPVAGADPDVDRLLQERVEALESIGGDDFPERVRALLRTVLFTGQASSKHVAALFSMHSRTLSRRLNASGISFRELLDQCRFEVTQRLLADSAMDVNGIAELLDYADASAFTRAFRRWSGTTPARWRAHRASVARRRE